MKFGSYTKPRKKLIVAVCRDFFGGLNEEAKRVALRLMGKKIELTEYESFSMDCIRQNMTDRLYMSSFRV